MKYILFLLLLFSFLLSEDKVVMMTENYPPYNMSIDNKLHGISVDVLKEILKEINSTQTIEEVILTNWSRAYSYAQKKKNHMVFSTTQTKNRKDDFKWVGPIAKISLGLIALKSKNIKIASVDDMNKYKIGVVLKDIGDFSIRDLGVKDSQVYSLGGKNAINLSLKKLEKGRIDLFSYNFDVVKYNAKLEEIDVSKFEIVYPLKGGNLYFAFNKNTDDSIIKKWQDALDKIKQNGTYDKIISKY